jgi:arginyl-tRNA synthetase
VPEGSALAVERAAGKGKGGAETEKVVSPAIAGPGFINVRVSRAWVARHIQAMLRDVRARAVAL